MFLEHLVRVECVRGPYLVIIPLSTVGHWKREVARVIIFHDHKSCIANEYMNSWFPILRRHCARLRILCFLFQLPLSMDPYRCKTGSFIVFCLLSDRGMDGHERGCLSRPYQGCCYQKNDPRL